MAKKQPQFPETAQEREERFMSDPDQWPNWPLLPVKKYVKGENRPVLGYLVDSDHPAFQHVVFYGMVFTANPREDPRVMYHSVAAIVADGWVVD